MPVMLTLEPGINTAAVPLDRLRRILIRDDPGAAELASEFDIPRLPTPMRMVQVDLDYVYDPDPVQLNANLGLLLDRVRAMGINTVFLQAFADPDGNGAADAVYFPNRHLPMRADLFSHVAWQLQSRGNVEVYAWMPLLAFELPPGASAARVQARDGKSGVIEYPRLSPFDPAARQVISELYADLARSATFQGLLFHDDATLGEFEDSSPAALHYYADAWGLPPDIEAIRTSPAQLARWTELKTRHLIAFSRDLADSVARYQGGVHTARNLFASVVLDPVSERWYAQSLPDFLAAYDFTAIMAMPFMENAPDPQRWLQDVVSAVARLPQGLQRSVFELQSVDWRNGRDIDSRLMAEKMRTLQLTGALSFGYYPDDFLRNHPQLDVIKPYFSLETFPYFRRGAQ